MPKTKSKDNANEIIEMKLLDKQMIAYEFLTDNKTIEVVYGGGARGGKSYLGCAWIIQSCFEYPESRWLIGRSRLKDLKRTTFKTFMKILSELGLEKGKDWQYNGQTDTLIFYETGSEVVFVDLFHYPQDPEYTKLGSLELTGAFLDECGEVPHLAKNIVLTRLSFMLEEYGITPKLLMTCNPKKNWLYFEYYEPWKKGQLKEDAQFIISLVDDNHYIAKSYIHLLENNITDHASVQRLRYGNWEYDNEDVSLFTYKNILDIFSNDHVSGGLAYITCDVARYGKDYLVIMVWEGLKVVETIILEKSSIPEIVELIKAYASKYRVPRSRIIVDDGGVGGGVVDYLPNCVSFVGASSPIDKENYKNLRTQCYYRLSEVVKDAELYVMFTNNSTKKNAIKEFIVTDLQAIERKNIDSDGKLEINSKDEIKGKTGRSPDFGDCLSMRMIFHKKKVKFGITSIYTEDPDYRYSDNDGYDDDD